MVCRHLNGNPEDARLNNLAWGTPKENGEDAVRHGRAQKKLTKEIVEEIKSKYRTGEYRQEDLAAEYGITQGMVGHIMNGRAWNSVL